MVLVVDLDRVEVLVVICVVVSVVEGEVVELVVVVVECKGLVEGLVVGVVLEGQLGGVDEDVAEAISQYPETSWIKNLISTCLKQKAILMQSWMNICSTQMNEPWTTINTPENTELYDSCYELDEFDIAVDICCTVASNCEQWDYIIMFATDHMFYYMYTVLDSEERGFSKNRHSSLLDM